VPQQQAQQHQQQQTQQQAQPHQHRSQHSRRSATMHELVGPITTTAEKRLCMRLFFPKVRDGLVLPPSAAIPTKSPCFTTLAKLFNADVIKQCAQGAHVSGQCACPACLHLPGCS
jgi:hypothetical protein